jgi:hypothetical protein
METKICRLCNQEKEISFFPIRNKKNNLRRTECSECLKGISKKHREADPEKAKEYQRERREAIKNGTFELKFNEPVNEHTTRVCKVCGKEKNLMKDFNSDASGTQGYRQECKQCRNAYHRNRQFTPNGRKDSYLKRTYDITLSQFNEMKAAQNNSCFVCKTHESKLSRDLVVDHCHVTGKVRKLLCDACNKALGILQEDPEAIKALLDYAEIKCTK